MRLGALVWITVPLGLGLAWGGIYMASQRPAVIDVESPDLWADLDTPRHPVTEEMLVETTEMSGVQAYDFELEDQDGESRSLSSYLSEKPVVMVMTKDGCPCSFEAQPFFNRLAETYGDVVQFVGVIDSERADASRWWLDLGVPYPMLSEVTPATYDAYRTPRSVYTTLISQDRQIIKQWPGYSQAMLLDLGDSIAQVAGVNPRPFDAETPLPAPEQMTSGCSFMGLDDETYGLTSPAAQSSD